MSDKPSELERLQHMTEAIDRILRFTDGMDYEAFSKAEMAQFAIIKNFEILGEAAYQLSKDFRALHDIEWNGIMGFRHVLVHDYYKINLEIVWRAVENKLIDLKIALEHIIEEIE